MNDKYHSFKIPALSRFNSSCYCWEPWVVLLVDGSFLKNDLRKPCVYTHIRIRVKKTAHRAKIVIRTSPHSLIWTSQIISWIPRLLNWMNKIPSKVLQCLFFFSNFWRSKVKLWAKNTLYSDCDSSTWSRILIQNGTHSTILIRN
jgi:hypothetical protein